jgi:DNA polymerase-3 subunit delta'
MLHPVTEKQLQMIAGNVPQALLLHGKQGVGFEAAVEMLAQSAGGRVEWVYPEKKEVIDRINGSITVDIIRRLYDTTKTSSSSPRIIVIDQAETMTHQAQNAFLKLLEEPGRHIYFVLVATNTSHLLPTILSRSQSFEVLPISSEQTSAYLDELSVTDTARRSQLVFLAEGLPQELQRLATDEAYLEQQRAIVGDARSLVQGTSYEALKVVHRYKEDRAAAQSLLLMAVRLLELSAQRKAEDRHVVKIDRLLEAYEALNQNGNVRLQLAAAVI